MNLLEERPAAQTYFKKNIVFFVLLGLASLIGIAFSYTVTAALLLQFSDFFGISQTAAYISAGIFEVLKAYTAKRFFAGLYIKPKADLDIIVGTFFALTWATAIYLGFSGAHRQAQSQKLELIASDTTSTAPPPSIAPPADLTKGGVKGLTETELKTMRRAAEAAKANAPILAASLDIHRAEMKKDSTAKAEILKDLQSKAEGSPYQFLYIDCFVLLCIFGCVHILCYKQNTAAAPAAAVGPSIDSAEDQNTDDSLLTDESLKARFVTARADGYHERAAELEREILSRGLKVPTERGKKTTTTTSPPSETPVIKITGQRQPNS